jgi:hypothetical protein
VWAWLAGLVVLSTLLRWWAASKVPTPWIVPDEVIYTELGRSLYESGSFEILGLPARFYSLVYPAFVGLPLSLDDVRLGYSLLKPLQALVMSLAAVPVYLWGRSLMSRWWALAAAALTLTVPGLAYAGLVMTEVAFYPIATLAVWASARAIAETTTGRQAVALGAILLAAATRLQGAVLAAVYVTALLLVAAFERSPRRLVRSWPALAGLALLAVGWAAWRLASGGPASEVFGAYRAAGEVGYSVSDSILYARWHAADVLLMTGVVPACAVFVLLWSAFAGNERSPDARAYLAVVTSLVLWLVAEVGIFASVHVGRLAERDLLAATPALFLGLALWLDRGGPRPVLPTIVAAAGALGLVLWLPVGRLVSLAAIPDAFTLIPLYRLSVRQPDLDLQLLVDLLAAAAVAGFALLPRRLLVLLPVAVGVFFAVTSFSVGRVVAAQATIVRKTTLAADPRWIDHRAGRPATFLYSSEAVFSSVWENLFWNRRLEHVNALLASRVFGLTDEQQPSVGPLPDGTLVLADGSRVRAPYAVAPAVLRLRGGEVAYAFAPALVLWRTAGPLRLSTWVQQEGNAAHRRVLAYDCRGGTLRLRLRSATTQRVTLTREGRPAGNVRLPADKRRTVSLAGVPARECRFGLDGSAPIDVEGLDFLRPGA